MRESGSGLRGRFLTPHRCAEARFIAARVDEKDPARIVSSTESLPNLLEHPTPGGGIGYIRLATIQAGNHPRADGLDQ